MIKMKCNRVPVLLLSLLMLLFAGKVAAAAPENARPGAGYALAPTLSMAHADLAGLSEGYIDVPLHQVTAGCVSQYGPLKIKVQADLGDVYNLGENAFTTAINVTITTYADMATPIQSWTAPFSLNQNSPEQLFIKTVTSNPAQVKYVKIKVNSYTNATVAAQNAIRLRAWTEEEDFISVSGVTITPASFTPNNTQWEQTFNWTPSCTRVPDYVFQLLRIYGSEPVDWDKALNIHTESATPTVTLSMAEGSGNYTWRVIPLGNLSGGIANPANWGTPSSAGTFSYTHPEDAKNWIYSRTFTEGNRVNEQVTYANGLQQAAQQQTRIQGDNQIVASQTLQDFVGRNAVNSLPVPAAGVNKLGYIPGLLKNTATGTTYKTADFDTDPRNPAAATDFGGYYSEGPQANTINQGVPRAEGYPFSQTIFAPDGRVREQAGVGYTHSVKGGKTVRTFYSHPSESELVRLFGKETPDISSVQKITTFDANNSASISYQTKDGKVIATALAVTSTTGPLTALPSAASATVNISEEVRGTQRADDHTLVSRKPLFVESDRQLTVDYQIDPGVVKEMCGNSAVNGMAAHYPMDGNANDLSGTGNNASLSGGVTVGLDATGAPSAYDLDGTNGYINANDVPQTDIGTGNFTVAFWVKKGAATSNWDNSAGVGKWNSASAPATTNEWAVNLSSSASNNLPSFSIAGGSTTYTVAGTTSLNTNQWYHIIAMRTGTKIVIFVNGVQEGLTGIPAGLAVNNQGRPLRIGRVENYYTQGAFDDLQIYQRALNAAEMEQLLKRGTVCSTCDYKVDILLYKEGDNVPVTLGTQNIQSVNCSGQASVKWDPAPFTPVTLSGGVNYVLEKRITLQTINPATSTTYIDETAALIENYYRTQYDNRLAPLNQYLDAGDMAGLYTYLGGIYGFGDGQYFVSLLPPGVGGCQDILNVPIIDPCPAEQTPAYDASCNRNGQSFEAFFASYYTGHATIIPLRPDGKLSYVFFKNLYTNATDPANANLYFAPGEFNTMVSNMIADNGLSCATVWEAWDEEVKGYESKMDAVFEDNSDPIYSFATPENNMFRSFLQNIEARLQQTLEQDQSGLQVKDICLNRPSASNPYFIKKTQLYGFFRQIAGGISAVVTPDLLHAYRLAYFNDNLPDRSHNKTLKFYRGNYTKQQIEDAAVIPSKQDFDALSECDRYRFSTNTQIGDEAVSESQIQEMINKIRGNCGEACETRAGDFRQAIIRSLFAQNPNTIIEHYNVYLDPNMDGNLTLAGVQAMYVGVQDITINTTGFTLSECELDVMVNKLVENCKNNYCNTPLTVHEEPHPDKPGFTVRVYGTDEERAKLSRPLEYNFEVDLKASGQNCGTGWDEINATSSNSPWERIKAFFAEASSYSIEFFYDSKFKKDAAGNFYVVGYLLDNGDEIKFNNGTSYFHTGATPGRDVFFAKFNPAGDVLWIRKHTITPLTAPLAMMQSSSNTNDVQSGAGTTPQFSELSIAEDNNGGIAFIVNVMGRSTTSGIVDQHGNQILTLPANLEAYTGEYDSNGNLIWIKAKGRVFHETFYALRKDGYNYIVPRHSGPYFIEKLDGAGNTVWSSDILSLGSTLSSPYHSEISFDMLTIDGNSNLYSLVNGYDNSGTIQVKVNGVVVGTYSGTELSFVIKFDHLGKYQWHKVLNPKNEIYSAIISGQSDGVLVVPIKQGGNIGPEYQFSVPAAHNVIFKVNSNGTLGWVRDYDFGIPGPFLVSFQEDNDNYYMAYRYDWPATRKYFIASIDKINLTHAIALVPQFGASYNKLKRFFVDGDKMDMIYVLGPSPDGGGSNPATDPHLLSITPQSNIAHTLFGTFTPNYFTCSISKTLCFRFTSPKSLPIPIPDGIGEEDIFNPKPETCADASASIVRNSIQQQKEQLIAARVKAYRDQYFSTCGNPSLLQDKLTISYSTGLHHFTLYYYDRAGNLIRTVPPDGVAFLDVSSEAALAAAKNALPNHQLVTEYQYNSMGQLIKEHSPDGNFDPGFASEYTKPEPSSTESQVNASKYYSTSVYNDKGQLRFSRNAKQKKARSYAYTKYDELGRVIEVGEASSYDETTLMARRNEIGRSGFPNTGIAQVTSTYYSDAFAGTLPTGYLQRYLRNRVSYSMLDEDGNNATTADQVTTVYSYDPHGNVEWLVQLLPGLSPVAIKYDYDLISGKVLQVRYNPGMSDQFYHKYDYDANNRIVAVYTSTDGALWERDAKYEYYKHGLLKRTVIGEDLVQGLDYTYTIHGWLKGLNHQYLDITSDPMKDADATEVSTGAKNHLTGRDAFGMALQYYSGDYKRTGSSLDAAHASTLVPATGKDLFNGNITSWASNGGGWATTVRYPSLIIAHKGITGYRYTYDELNRLITSSFVTGTAYTPTTNFNATYAYTANGNITTAVVRGANTNLNLDNLTYNYVPGTNRLREVTEAWQNSPADVDLENQAINNYTYDPIGNLIGDAQQGTVISWTPYGKVKQVTKGTASTQFLYDASGNRVMKKRTNGSGVSTINFYVRDASGNILSVYERIDQDSTTGTTLLTEVPLYGSDRLGTFSRGLMPGTPATPLEPGEILISSNTTKTAYEGASYVYTPNATVTLGSAFIFTGTANTTFRIRPSTTQPETEMYTRTLSSRQYELKDHLGNVRAVVGDVKLSTIVSNAPQAFEPKLISLSNYYPFGMDQPERMWSAAGKYRYGFNGKEKDDNGEWGQTAYDYGFRIYNPSIGKFLSVDPLTKSYPWYTPYQFAGNTPIAAIDLDGLEEIHYKFVKDEETGKPKLKYSHYVDLKAERKFVVDARVQWNAGNDESLGWEFWEDVTFTFDSYEGMKEAEKRGGVGHDAHWTWMGSDQRLKIALAIIPFNMLETEGETGGMRGLWKGLKIPQGLTKTAFKDVSSKLRSKVSYISDDIVVQGSRAAGSARSDSDIDFAIKVSEEDFNALIKKYFKTPNPKSALEKTMNRAIETGKIQAGEAKLSGLRRELEADLGFEVDLSIIRTNGPTDNGAQIPILKEK